MTVNAERPAVDVRAGSPGPPLLELDGVSTEIVTPTATIPIVLDASWSIGRGEIVGLVGESGSGKSMTARTIIRSLPRGARTTGRVLLDGEDLVTMPRARLREARARAFGVIFQDPRSAVDPLWTIEDHLTEGMRVHDGLSRAEARKRAIELLGSVGIRGGAVRLRQYPSQLSGGMLQRVVIAGALAGDPQLIIADEPTASVDVTTQAEIVAIFAQLRRDRGLAMLFITHDLGLAASLCDRIMVMYAGRIVEAQTHDRILSQPAHPYSAALAAARPTLEQRGARLHAIPGAPTTAAAAPPGCPFHPRCRFAIERCRKAVPTLRPVGEALAACIRSEEIRHELRTLACG